MSAIAAKQHGLVSRRQLLDSGVPRTTVDAWAASGRLHRVHRGVFAVGHDALGLDARWAAAVLAAGPGAAVSRRSSGELQRILPVDELAIIRSPIHVTRPGSASRRDGLVIHSSAIDPRDLTDHRGIPTTKAARTIFDLTPQLTRRGIERSIEQAQYMGILDKARLQQLCAAAPGHRNIAVLRELIGFVPMSLDRVRSRLELLALRICREHLLAEPLVNVQLLGHEVDLLWPDQRFVVEADGGHHVGERRDADNSRDIDLARAGYLTRRYSESALEREDEVGAEILEILRERPLS